MALGGPSIVREDMRASVLLALLLAAVLVGLSLSALTVRADDDDEEEEREFDSKLSGANEVPMRVTGAKGRAEFELSEDGLSLSYELEVKRISNVFMAHIHRGPAGVNGPIVVWLYPSTAPVPAPAGGGPIRGEIAEGVITAANLVGPLAGQPLSALVALIDGAMAYVNVHTDDGVGAANTGPGDFPGGEIRGQVRVED